jgi:hypothetical protein
MPFWSTWDYMRDFRISKTTAKYIELSMNFFEMVKRSIWLFLKQRIFFEYFKLFIVITFTGEIIFLLTTIDMDIWYGKEQRSVYLKLVYRQAMFLMLCFMYLLKTVYRTVIFLSNWENNKISAYLRKVKYSIKLVFLPNMFLGSDDSYITVKPLLVNTFL